MSVRRRQWRDPLTGATKERWMIDIVVEHRDGRTERVRKVAPIQNKRAAEQYEREVRQALLDGPTQHEQQEEEIESPTFAAFAKEFLGTYAKNNNKPSEEQSKEMILRVHLNPAFEGLTLDAIGPRQIEAYKAKKRAEGKAPKTINNHLTVLRRLFAVAVEWGQLKRIPCIRWLKAQDPEFDFLTFDEAQRLIAAADPEWRPMIVVALKCGLRQGEMLALRWVDVDLVTGRLMVRRGVSRGVIGTPKGGRSREVALSPEALRTLEALRRTSKGELVFSAPSGNMLTKGACKHPLRRAYKRAGLRPIGWHALRHTFASHLVMRGVAIKAVQELLGHQTIEMTMRYAHLSPDVRRDAVHLLDEVEPPPATTTRRTVVNGYGTTTAHGAAEVQNL